MDQESVGDCQLHPGVPLKHVTTDWYACPVPECPVMHKIPAEVKAQLAALVAKAHLVRIMEDGE